MPEGLLQLAAYVSLYAIMQVWAWGCCFWDSILWRDLMTKCETLRGADTKRLCSYTIFDGST